MSEKILETKPLESKESEPKLHFRMLYSGHDSEKDFWSPDELEQELQDIDIWFPENFGWNQDSENLFKKFATGNYAVSENIEPVLKFQLEALTRLGRAGKKIVVWFVDFPEDHPLLKYFEIDFDRALSNFSKGNCTFISNSY